MDGLNHGSTGSTRPEVPQPGIPGRKR